MTSALYRSFLRVFEKWPVDVSKKGRDLGEHLRICVADAFRASEPRDSRRCEEIQLALNRIAGNKYKEAFYVSGSSSASGLPEVDCQQLISNESLKLMEEDEKGMVAGLKEKLFKK